jgi:hypothetical protein
MPLDLNLQMPHRETNMRLGDQKETFFSGGEKGEQNF